jgi:hypothetical protein
MPTYTVDLFSGPAQCGGFRSGWFAGTVDGKPVRFWGSVNCHKSPEEQREDLLNQLRNKTYA